MPAFPRLLNEKVSFDFFPFLMMYVKNFGIAKVLIFDPKFTNCCLETPLEKMIKCLHKDFIITIDYKLVNPALSLTYK